MAYSMDFIKRAVAYKQEGHTFKELKEVFNIPSITYYDWVEKLETGFEFGALVKKERNRKINKEALRQAVEDQPEAFQRELAEQFNCNPSAICQALQKMDITRKKNIHIF
jgi:transposase